MLTVLCSCSLSRNDNPVIYNINSDRNIQQKILNENVNETKPQGS